MTDSSEQNGSIQKLINHLIQLQDLIFAKDQQMASMPGSRLTDLEKSINTLMNDLPDNLSMHFRKMHKKHGLALVPISNGNCSACGMAIPVSQVHAVHAADNVYTCPSCARFLFYPNAPARRVGAKKRKRGEPVQVGIARFSAPSLMLPRMKSKDRDGCIRELCEAMEEHKFVDHGEKLFEEALRREAIMSTAVDPAMAFPHVRGVEGGGMTLALGTHSKGVRFNEGSRSLTRIIFMIVIPTAASAFYLKLLSGVTQTFRDADKRDALLEAKTQEDLWKVLVKSTRTTVL